MSVGALVPTGLLCAHKQGPLSVEADRVRFSWHFAADGDGRRQTAYQVRVAREEADFDGDGAWPWDSGRTEDDGSTGIAYAGAPLESGSLLSLESPRLGRNWAIGPMECHRRVHDGLEAALGVGRLFVDRARPRPEPGRAAVG